MLVRSVSDSHLELSTDDPHELRIICSAVAKAYGSTFISHVHYVSLIFLREGLTNEAEISTLKGTDTDAGTQGSLDLA